MMMQISMRRWSCLITFLSGCGIPLNVAQVKDPSAPVTGMHYTLLSSPLKNSHVAVVRDRAEA
jgi:hypothetical protein